MLGELISELKGKVTGRRVLDVEGPTIDQASYRAEQRHTNSFITGNKTSRLDSFCS